MDLKTILKIESWEVAKGCSHKPHLWTCSRGQRKARFLDKENKTFHRPPLHIYAQDLPRTPGGQGSRDTKPSLQLWTPHMPAGWLWARTPMCKFLLHWLFSSCLPPSRDFHIFTHLGRVSGFTIACFWRYGGGQTLSPQALWCYGGRPHQSDTPCLPPLPLVVCPQF